MRLKDKVAIITGAGSGFGAGIAKRFALEGARVVVNDILTAAGEQVAGEIATAGGKALFVRGDVTRGADWANLVGATESAFGKLDIVVNNAGWTHRKKPYLETTEAELMHTIFPHPTLSEMMHEAVLDAYGRVIHI